MVAWFSKDELQCQAPKHELDCGIHVITAARMQLNHHELLAMKHNRVCIGKHQQDGEVWELLIFEQNSQWLGVHRITFQRNGGINLPSQECFTHAWPLEVIPEEAKRTSLGFTATSFTKWTWMRESHFQHPEHIPHDDTRLVLTSFQH